MSVVDDYLATLVGPERAVLAHLYAVVRATVPDATEELSYNMPAFKQNGKALISIMANKNFLSVYPFSNLEPLGLDFSAYETTKGSIHFSVDKPISDEFLREIIKVRLKKQN